MEQLVARRAHNPKVARSSRVLATKGKRLLILATFFLWAKNYVGIKILREIDSN